MSGVVEEPAVLFVLLWLCCNNAAVANARKWFLLLLRLTMKDGETLATGTDCASLLLLSEKSCSVVSDPLAAAHDEDEDGDDEDTIVTSA